MTKEPDPPLSHAQVNAELSERRTGVAVASVTVVAIVAVLAVGGWRPVSPALIVLLGGLGLASALDLVHRRVPNNLIAATTGAVTVLLAVASVLDDDGYPLGALVGGIVLFLMFWAIHTRSPGQFGAADVKLSFVIGLTVSWFSIGQLRWLLLFTLAGLLVVGVPLLLAHGRGSGRVIAFVPVMSVATALTLIRALA